MFRFFTTSIVATVFMLTAASLATAQTVSRGQLSGIVSGGGTAVPAFGSAVVYTTPAEGFFILTQACASNPGCMKLAGGTVGPILFDSGMNSGTCINFSPGIALPAAEVLTATETCGSGDPRATVTGVISKK